MSLVKSGKCRVVEMSGVHIAKCDSGAPQSKAAGIKNTVSVGAGEIA